MYKRLLELNLPARQSAFLWGGRKTGKSTYLHYHFPTAVYYDFLKTDLFVSFSKEPHLLREEVLSLTPQQLETPIILDEVQKIPQLLDEVHWLIENTAAQFILCGSSARKLKKGAANLLGGRAWRFEFFPLVYPEITDFNLQRALNHGLLPSHYISEQPKRSLRSYIQDYLKEEIQQEGLTRNLPAFARFLDSLGFSHGQLTNYSNIAKDCGIDAKTVKEYYQILIDTLLGSYLYPYKKKIKRDTITATPKFYLFDVGIANHLMKRTIESLSGIYAGDAFEHYILMELRAYCGLNEIDLPITYWRTKTNLEVDFVLGDATIAIEVKISPHPKKSELKGLLAFIEEHAPKKAIVISLAERARRLEINNQTIEILPYKKFLEQLWAGKIINASSG